MEKIKLTVFFEDPFWIGVFEKSSFNGYEVCKITFGSEPKDYETYNFIMKNYFKLKFSQPIKENQKEEIRINKKRMQRLIKKQVKNKGTGTKAQNALKLMHENAKETSKKLNKERKDHEKELKYNLKKQKKKEKHKGH